MERERRALLGTAADAHDTFPWLVKFLDAHDWLSVQVHPDAEAVKRLLPGEGSKTEAWFVLDASPQGRIYAGLKPGVTEADFRRALAAGTVADCLHQFTPRPGDCVFLPAGTVHAVGGGVLFAEVQQTSDATFRLFDWGRRDAQGRARTLHLDEGLACLDWGRGPVEPVRAEGPGLRPLVRCPYFHLDYVQIKEPASLGGEGRLQAVLVLAGSGRLGGDEVRAGQVWLLPATAQDIEVIPQTALTVLLCSLP
jgi:mannose-6-phosphate isomerase